MRLSAVLPGLIRPHKRLHICGSQTSHLTRLAYWRVTTDDCIVRRRRLLHASNSADHRLLLDGVPHSVAVPSMAGMGRDMLMAVGPFTTAASAIPTMRSMPLPIPTTAMAWAATTSGRGAGVVLAVLVAGEAGNP